MKKILLILLINSCFYNAALFDNIDILTKNSEDLERKNSRYIENIKEVSKNFFQDKKIIYILRKIVQEVDSHNGMIGFIFDKNSKTDVVSGLRKILNENPYFINKLRSEICDVDDLFFSHVIRKGKDMGFTIRLLKSGISFAFIFNDIKNFNLTGIDIPIGIEKTGDKYIMHSRHYINF